MKKIFLYASLFFAGFVVSCSSDIDTEGSNEINNIDTTTINEKAKDTIGIELLVSDKYLILTSKEERFLYYAAKEGMMAINSVLLPEGDNPAMPHDSLETSAAFENPDFVSAARLADVSDGNYAFMYTVSGVLNDSIPVVMGQKLVNDKTSNDYSDNFVIFQKRNKERNKYVYSNVFRYAPYGVRFLYNDQPAMGTNGKDTVVAKVPTGLMVGVYDEANDSIMWENRKRAFVHLNDANASGSRYYQMLPPTITYSSKFGFLMFSGSQIDAASTKPGYIFKINPNAVDDDQVVTEVALKSNQTGGARVGKGWAPQLSKGGNNLEELAKFENVVVYSVETDQLSRINDKNEEVGLPKGSLIAFGMNKEKVYQTFYRYKEGDQVEDIRFEYAYQVNFDGTETKHSPVNVIVNPYNGRIELVHSTPYLMTLHSIDVEDLVSTKLNTIARKEWTRECILLSRDISIRGNGMYPTGVNMISPDAMVFSPYMSTVEKIEQNNPNNLQPGVQRIFFCAGNEYPSRIGVFELVRTLDTKNFSKWVDSKRAFIEGQTY